VAATQFGGGPQSGSASLAQAGNGTQFRRARGEQILQVANARKQLLRKRGTARPPHAEQDGQDFGVGESFCTEAQYLLLHQYAIRAYRSHAVPLTR
jgi:hypothetical protein